MKDDIITLAHGGGGIRTQQLLQDIVFAHLDDGIAARLDDSACIEMKAGIMAMTTDSYVVSPIFFPGGDIGMLAACGTINDLAMQGARPTHISLALILEEGTLIADVRRAIESFLSVCKKNGVVLATGDTKVVERGKGNGIFINTTGIGSVLPDVDVYVGNARPGDSVIVSGTIGDHGIAVLSSRKEMGIKTSLNSDVAPLWTMVRQLLAEIPSIHCLRDPTRGGIAAALCDIASASQVGIRFAEQAVPTLPQVDGACDLLGL
ncbi:MAG: hydrogenase expression/formation protein HypE, partial [Candidatus Electrothrix sp. GM3_4]|nr:hydrogenase expression/formation protein HypE [Candidatus Electrothrix sp. GM3_4]